MGGCRDCIYELNWSHLVIVLCAIGGHAVNLIPFSYGILQVYVFSYLYDGDKSITMNMMHLHAPLCLAFGTGTAWTFGLFMKVIHPIILHVFNGLALSFWMLFLYFFSHSYVIITVAMAFVGFHCGQLHIFFSQRVTEEGKRRPAQANGFYGFFFGVAGIWGNLLGTIWINPWNVEKRELNGTHGGYVFDDARILERTRTLWIILAVVIFILLLPGYFVIGITRKETRRGSIRYSHRNVRRERSKSVVSRIVEDTYAHNLEDDDAFEDETYTFESKTEPLDEQKRIMRRRGESIRIENTDTKIFSGTGFVLFATTVGIGVSSMCAFDLYKDYGLRSDTIEDDDRFFNMAGLLIPIVGAVGRIAWGIMGDQIPFQILFISGNVITAILQIGMYFGRCNRYSYVMVCSALAIMPGMMTLLPPAIRYYMGTKDIGLKFGIVLTGEVFGCAYYLLNASVFRSYIMDLPLMLILSVPAALAIIPTFFILRSRPENDIVVENKSAANDYNAININK